MQDGPPVLDNAPSQKELTPETQYFHSNIIDTSAGHLGDIVNPGFKDFLEAIRTRYQESNKDETEIQEAIDEAIVNRMRLEIAAVHFQKYLNRINQLIEKTVDPKRLSEPGYLRLSEWTVTSSDSRRIEELISGEMDQDATNYQLLLNAMRRAKAENVNTEKWDARQLVDWFTKTSPPTTGGRESNPPNLEQAAADVVSMRRKPPNIP